MSILSGSTCSSEIGLKGGQQVLYMNDECFKDGLLKPVHELLHTLGFIHEHTRNTALGTNPKFTFFVTLNQPGKNSQLDNKQSQKYVHDIFFLILLPENSFIHAV